ncbi:MAG: HAMP domain-containing protein [Bacteroidetes bacterium]|nr:HAMP domain-containing protein [Bacteroidota bacterium]
MRRSSLSWKLVLGIVPVLLISLSISVILHNRFQEAEMMEQAQVSAHTYADLIRESLVSMMVHSQEVDTSFLVRVNAIQQFDSLAVLVNHLKLREELLSDEQIERVRAKEEQTPDRDTTQSRVLSKGEPVFFRTGEQFRAVIPFNATEVCQKCHAVPVGYTLGAADVRFSLSRFADATAGNWRRSVIIFVVFTVVAVGIGILVFRRTVARPIDRLVRATTELQQGNLTYRITQEEDTRDLSRDELGFLAERFDDMRESLADKIARLDQANRDLSKRNTELEETLERLHRTQEELVRTERLAVTGKMAAQLSHEINNPIHNTQSLLESTLRRLQGGDQVRELIGLALEEVTRMASLTRQLLDVHRGSVMDVPMASVDLLALLREMERTHQEALLGQGIALRVSAEGSPGPVRGSKDKLKQVILNLLLNARDAMPDGGRLTMELSEEAQWVVLRVRDTGVGIAPEHRGRIFEAFFTTKTEVRGVGLGLSVTYGIVKQHRGFIDFESTPGAGTTFTVRLPADHVEQHAENA